MSDWSNPGGRGSLLDLIRQQKGKSFLEGARDVGKSMIFGDSDIGLSPNPMTAGMVINRRNLPRMLEQWQSNARLRPMQGTNPENIAAQAWLETIAPRFANQMEVSEKLVPPHNNELIEAIGNLTNLQMWKRIERQSEKAGRIPPGVFNRVTRMQDAARNKFMRFLDLLVEEKGPSEASEILTNIGRRPE